MTGNPDSVGQVRPGRIRARRRTPAGPDQALLVKYRQAVRAELEATLAELSPGSEPGLFGPNVKRPPLAERIQLWGLADRLARNLAALDLDPGPPADAPAPRPARAAPRRARAGRIAGL